MRMNLYSLILLTEESAGVTSEIAESANDIVATYGLSEYLFTGFGMLFVFLFFAAPLFLAVIPARIAKNKGRNFAGYYVFGYFALIPAIIVVNVLKPVEMQDTRGKTMSEIIRGHK